ncbi:MAG: CRISPR system precrRNA processing endoribonuclease RAMP protein Cas6 [Euryarchaeota archaeon]|nr:CRISPR system precrRNA processing endoribonuclease RAMP protein Cas6 [Euryarchaeota archaeon]
MEFLKMKSTLIMMDIKTNGHLRDEFTGSIFRGWLGFILKCNPGKPCNGCSETNSCPYFMVFKEKTDIKPYSILSFKSGDLIRNFIKIYGDRKKYAPKILSDIKDKASSKHFGGLKYSIESLEAKNIEIPNIKLSSSTIVAFVSPVHLLRNRRTEVIPSFSSLLASSVRSYNRITKYYDPDVYPYKISEELLNAEVPILDFDVKTMKHIHTTMEDRSISLEGSTGWIKFDTSSVPSKAGEVLKIGEALQIGKHTTYGFGGFMLNTEA